METATPQNNGESGVSYCSIAVTLTIEGPVLTHSTSAGAFGLDAVMAKNSDNEYYLPSSLVKGLLKQSWEELDGLWPSGLGQPEIIKTLLGDKAENAPPVRGKLRFTDFIFNIEGNANHGRIHRIAIDQDLRSVKKGALQVIESIAPAGKEVTASGSISFYATTTDAGTIHKQIDIGLKWITSVGAFRSIGFGRLKKVTTELVKESVKNNGASSLVEGDEICLAITFDEPFCVCNRPLRYNVFESETVIPGGVLKGAVADILLAINGRKRGGEIDKSGDGGKYTALMRNFGKIRFSHAFPSLTPGVRPVEPPLSLAMDDAEKCVKDMAFAENLKLDSNGKSPKFAVDWKDAGKVRKLFGWDDGPYKEIRIRTAIDGTTRRAKKSDLFAYEMVIPKNYTWFAKISLADIGNGDKADKADVASQLHDVLTNGIHGLGKTKASATVNCSSKFSPCLSGATVDTATHRVITLQTPAILLDPLAGDLKSNGSQPNLLKAYREAWKSISGNSLCLERFFAKQGLYGGEYLYKRFQSDKSYYPYVLTEPGSVFVFKMVAGQEVTAKCFADSWLKKGLPIPDWARERYGMNTNGGDTSGDWQRCPYIPQNGYGEIAVNLKLDLLAKGQEAGDERH